MKVSWEYSQRANRLPPWCVRCLWSAEATLPGGQMLLPFRYRNFYTAFRNHSSPPPMQRVPTNTFVLRSVAAQYKGVPTDHVSARTIRKGSIADHRWTGARASGQPGRGALYVSMHLDAMSNETLHYNRGPISIVTRRPLMTYSLQDTATFVYALRRPLWVADLSLESNEGRAYLEQLGAKKEVDGALLDAGFKSLAQAYRSDDYSFCRALGHALLDEYGPQLDGLRVVTARDEYPKLGETGENLALFGEDNAPLGSLREVSQTHYDVNASGQLTQTVTKLGPAAPPP
ncbi:MAG TPA: RES family NAD+ phosphorylase [Polyangiales bacterium]|nr:RES family NAD+ phosphorylase [Polyangiales bacterium]